MAVGPDRGENADMRVASPRTLAVVTLIAVLGAACSDDAPMPSGSPSTGTPTGCRMPRIAIGAVVPSGTDPVLEGPSAGTAKTVAIDQLLHVKGSGFRTSCRSKAPAAGPLSVELVQGDRRTLVAQVAVQGEDGSFEVTGALPSTVQVGPAAVEVKPQEGDPPRSAHAVASVVVEVPGG